MNISPEKFYMNIVDAIAEASHSQRAKVGALLERDGNIIAFGYNGTPSGFDNACEYEFRGQPHGEKVTATKPEVLHAESNAIAKCARSTHSSEDCILYCTYSPCLECAKLIIQAGIRAVVYKLEYRDPSGLKLLNKAEIPTMKI